MAMENNNNNSINNSNSINDLPLELIREILLRLPVKHLARLRCVSNLWLSLISDPNLAKSHLQLSLAPTHSCLFIQNCSEAQSTDLDAIFYDHDDDDDGHAAAAAAAAVAVKKVPLPLKKKPPSDFNVLGSCRGLILLHRHPHFLIIWNPLTGSHKRISYSHIVRNNAASYGNSFKLLRDALLYGFGYDALGDDYLVALAWKDKNKEDHLDVFSLRTNSWKSFDVVLPKPMRRFGWEPCGLFFNGAIHWFSYPLNIYTGDDYTILIFDLMERSFSEIPVPVQVVMFEPVHLVVLGGCLALYFLNPPNKTEIWVMKEYKVQSSWTLYKISRSYFRPLCVSKGGDIIGLDNTTGLFKYNVRGELLQHFEYFHGVFDHTMYTVYTDSLLPLPNDFEEKKKNKKKKGCQVRRECFERLDVVRDQNHNEVKQGKRIRSAPTSTCNFCCN